jgi:hypothetical protein
MTDDKTVDRHCILHRTNLEEPMEIIESSSGTKSDYLPRNDEHLGSVPINPAA